MSFRIDDLLKPDEKKGKKRLKNEPSHIRHIHEDFDEMGGILHHREKSIPMDFFKDNDDADDEDEDKEKTNNDNKPTDTIPTTTTHRKRRILFTREQTYELQKVFQYQQYLTVPQRDYLSRKINLTPTQVKIWFQNHRYKLKKYVKECSSKPKGKYPFFETKSATSPSYERRPPYFSGRISPYPLEIASYKRHESPERPTMYPLSKSFSRYSPDRILFTSNRMAKYTSCCDCDRYTPPPLKKLKSSRSCSEGCSKCEEE